MPPGMLLTPPSLLVRVTAGVVATGVVTLALLLTPPPLIVAALLSCLVPAPSGLTTVTANVAELEAPAARPPMVSVQAIPAVPPPAQLHPAVLPAASKIVLAGTVSSITTPVRPILPLLA